MEDGHSKYSEFDPTLEDVDAVELGQAYELISNEAYVPCHKSRGWIRSYVNIDDEDYGFRMYLEGSKRFLFSGKQFGQDLFLISMHEDFPYIESRTNRGHFARVARQRDSSFLLSLNCCHLCDHKLGHYTCGRGIGQREVVAKIVHSVRRFRNSSADIRCILVTIPPILESGKRLLWCPRSLRYENPNMPMSAGVNEFLASTPGIAVRYVNRLPDYSKELGCLVLKFQGNRILNASSKNFLLQGEPTKSSTGAAAAVAKDKEKEKTQQKAQLAKSQTWAGYADKIVEPPRKAAEPAVMQFGRSEKNKYVLDFRYPLSPIQAFGIALSSFGFDPKVAGGGRVASPSPTSGAKLGGGARGRGGEGSSLLSAAKERGSSLLARADTAAAAAAAKHASSTSGLHQRLDSPLLDQDLVGGSVEISISGDEDVEFAHGRVTGESSCRRSNGSKQSDKDRERDRDIASSRPSRGVVSGLGGLVGPGDAAGAGPGSGGGLFGFAGDGGGMDSYDKRITHMSKDQQSALRRSIMQFEGELISPVATASPSLFSK